MAVLISLAIIAIVSVAYMIKTKRKLWPSIICAVAVLLIFAEIFNAVSTTRNIPLTDEMLTAISQIDWSVDNRDSLGFEFSEGKYRADYEGPDFYCTIHVTDEVDEDLIYGEKEYGDITYTAVERRIGSLAIIRLFEKDLEVIRNYVFVVDGVQIQVTEDNIESNPSAFGEYLLELAAQS